MKNLLFFVLLLPVMVTAQPMTFTEHTAHGLTAVTEGAIISADVNNDGNEDLFVIGTENYFPDTFNATLYFGNGNGGFSPAPTQPFIELALVDAQFGDIDGDGDMDLVASGIHWISQTHQTNVYLNNGAGVFTLFTTLPGIQHGGVALGDLDGDGDMDIVVTGFLPGNGRLTAVYRNDGTHFTTVSTGMENLKGGDVAIFDYDNDGDLDVLITGHNDVMLVTRLYRNNGNFNFSLVSGTPFVGVAYASFAVGDIDGNGYIDVIITGEVSLNNHANEVYRNNAGVFTHSQSLPGIAGGDVQLGDFNNDGHLDVFMVGSASSGTISRLFKNDGAGVFIFDRNFSPGMGTASAVLLDFNSDGKLDLIYTGSNFPAVVIKAFRNTTAMFEYAVATVASPAQGGTTGGDGIYLEETEVTVTAAPAPQYQFNHWLDEDGEVVSTEAHYTFTLVSDITLTAVFSPTMSVEDISLAGVVLYPNPTYGVLNITVPDGVEITGVYVTDLAGRGVSVSVVGNTIDLSQFSSGIYLVTVQSYDAQVTKKVIKK